MDPSVAKIQPSQRHSPCFFPLSYLFVKFQSLLNDYVNKEMKQYLELEELNKNDILFPAPVFNSE